MVSRLKVGVSVILKVMKITSYTFLPVLVLVTGIALLFGLQTSAQEDSEGIDSSVSDTYETFMPRPEAGSDLNSLSNDGNDAGGTGGGYDPSIREGGQTVDAGTVPEKQQQDNGAGDVDGDGYADAALVEPDYLDEDSDDDGLADALEKEIEVVEYRNGDSQNLRSVEVDGTSVQLMESLSMDATTPLLQPGIRVAITADSCVSENGSDCDDGDTEAAPLSASFDISVAGAVVRGWNPEQKKELRSRASEMNSIETPSDFGVWLATKVLEDESIAEADVSNDAVVVKYSTKARLFGFLPITVPATARLGGRIKTGDMTLERNDPSEVEVEYPWYGFLVRKQALNDQLVSSTVEIADNYNASQKKAAKFKAGKALAETVK